MFSGSGEFMPTPDTALAIRKITAKASSRIARSAFELAMQRRKHVTSVHKQNVMRVSDGLFLAEVRKVAAEFPEVQYDEQLVDSMAALLVRDAARFDVVVTTNMFGDILSDEASELSGSLGLAGSVNASATHCMAQASHGSAPDIAGQDIANPTSLLLSAAMLMDWLAIRHHDNSFHLAAQKMVSVIDAVLLKPESRTKDLGGSLGTKAFTNAICQELSSS
jgi:3-isopropylmalate dehydrogenase